jgi:mannose/fructose-specific phosphotransferase system component IIA
MRHQLEALTTPQQLSLRSTHLAASLHLLLGRVGRVAATDISIAAQLPADGRRGSVDQAGNPTQAEALGMTDLNGGALFNAEFGIRHRGSTVPERSGVALSFCRRLATYGEGDVAMLKENSEELYELNIENFKSVLEGYALSFNVTKEVQVKGPIKPEFITRRLQELSATRLLN